MGIFDAFRLSGSEAVGWPLLLLALLVVVSLLVAERYYWRKK